MRAILLNTVKFFWRIKSWILIVTFYVHHDNPLPGLGIHRSSLLFRPWPFPRIKLSISPFFCDLGGRTSDDKNLRQIFSDNFFFLQSRLYWRVQMFFIKKLNVFFYLIYIETLPPFSMSFQSSSGFPSVGDPYTSVTICDTRELQGWILYCGDSLEYIQNIRQTEWYGL